jgi:hypothetical protein
VAGSCEHHNGYSGSIKSSKLLDKLSDYQTVEDSPPWKQLLIPCALTEHHAIKAYWGSESIAPLIL